MQSLHQSRFAFVMTHRMWKKGQWEALANPCVSFILSLWLICLTEVSLSPPVCFRTSGDHPLPPHSPVTSLLCQALWLPEAPPKESRMGRQTTPGQGCKHRVKGEETGRTPNPRDVSIYADIHTQVILFPMRTRHSASIVKMVKVILETGSFSWKLYLP